MEETDFFNAFRAGCIETGGDERLKCFHIDVHSRASIEFSVNGSKDEIKRQAQVQLTAWKGSYKGKHRCN